MPSLPEVAPVQRLSVQEKPSDMRRVLRQDAKAKIMCNLSGKDAGHAYEEPISRAGDMSS